MTAGRESGRIFRAGLPADGPSIRSLFLEANLTPPAAADLERIGPALPGAISTFVSEQEGLLVAVLGWRSLGEEAEILDLAVHPSRRRQGHASFLMENFLAHVAQSAVQGIFLEVRASNAAAIALYGKFGFCVSGRRPRYYRKPDENALLMQLRLRV